MDDDEINLAAVALSQEEIDKVLTLVREDNEENDSACPTPGVAITQDELERLFSGPSIPFKFPGSQNTSEDTDTSTGTTATLRTAEASPGTTNTSDGTNMSDAPEAPSEPTGEDTRAARIAERKARMAEMLAQANASSPKRISVVYGTALKTGAELDKAKEGSVLELDRLSTELAEIFVDGKLYARGKLGTSKDGHAAIKITQIC